MNNDRKGGLGNAITQPLPELLSPVFFYWLADDIVNFYQYCESIVHVLSFHSSEFEQREALPKEPQCAVHGEITRK
jgi:hypothetical protein